MRFAVPTPQEAVVAAELPRIVEQARPGSALVEVALVGRGFLFAVYRAVSADAGPLAIRVPRHDEWTHGPHSVTRPVDLLRQEAVYAESARSAGVPTPPVVHLQTDGPLPFMASTYVEHDQSPVSPGELARVVDQIHAVPVPELRPAEQGALSANQVVASRLCWRARKMVDLFDEDLHLPEPLDLVAKLDAGGVCERLLHMDLRPDNLLTRRGRLLAVIDWGNALFGDPALEHARLAEFGMSASDDWSPNAPAARAPDVEIVYRLDTVVMQATVHEEIIGDPTTARRYLARALQLREELACHWIAVS